jgi:hypothetical protein
MSDLFNPPAAVRQAEGLGELAAQINAAHDQAEVAFRAGLEHARRAGACCWKRKRAAATGNGCRG